MITYGLLRYLGKEKQEAAQLLSQLREVTAAQVGEDRWPGVTSLRSKRGLHRLDLKLNTICYQTKRASRRLVDTKR